MYLKNICLLLGLALFTGATLPASAQYGADIPEQPYNPAIQNAAELTPLYLSSLRNKKVALVVNPTSMVGKVHLVDHLLSYGIKVVKVFAPEHGFRGTADAGERISNEKDAKTGLPIVSLYGNNKKPKPEQLADVDIVVFDIQDVGARFYTYISTLQYVMEACADKKLPLLVLDRPNPNGFYVDGPVLELKQKSFIGMQRIPVVHGMTIGEYAGMLNGEKWLEGGKSCDPLIVVTCKNYTHQSRYDLPVAPSPNLKSMTAIYLYPSTCFFEGTVLSLGRGTDMPFQMYGHPSLPENTFPYTFTPVSKPGAKTPPLMDQLCHGKLVASTPEAAQKAIDGRIQLQWLIEAYQAFPDKDKFFIPFINKLAGNESLQEMIKAGKTEAEIRASWAEDLKKFKEIRKKYLLYPDFEQDNKR